MGSVQEKLRSVSRFVGRQEIAKILGYADLVRQTSGLAGSIADCGVYFGSGLMNYANILAALEPYNYQCRVIGFDTFSGDTGHSEVDLNNSAVDRRIYRYEAGSLEDLRVAAEIYDLDRPVSQIQRIELIEGDLSSTAPQFIANNPNTVFRIVHLSVNLYQPTLDAIKAFYPRLTRGGILAIQGLNFTVGASKAMFDAFESFGYEPPAVRVLDYYPNLTFIVKE